MIKLFGQINLQKDTRRKGWLIGLAGAVFTWLLLCLFLTPVYTTVTLEFAQDPKGEVITTVYSGPGIHVSPKDAKNRVVNSGVARISFLDIQYGKHCSLKRIDPLDQAYSSQEPLTIQQLTVRKNGIQTICLSGRELSAYFTGNEDIVFAEGEDFTFYVTGEDPQLLPTGAFQELYVQKQPLVLCLAFLLFGIAGILLLALFYWFAKEIRTETIHKRLTYCLFLGGLLGAVFMCIYTGLRSPFWLNPDEYDVKAAVLYYFSHFMPPDIRSDIINDSYPVYGTSRHFEWNLFYFYAGKLGQFFKDAAVQIRLFNLSLFALMAGIVIRNIRKNYALLFVLLLTPQVWYIFSYSTSDSLDFFAGFLCLYQLVEKNSMLNRLLRERFRRRHILYYGLLSVLFIHLFWAKASFYPVLIFLFLILLIRLIYKEKKERGPLLRKYLILVGLTLGIFVVRYLITDYPYYGFDKLGTIMEVTERQAEYGYKPSTPAMESAYSMRFYEKGITLKEFFRDYDFNKNLFRTFAGFFGSYAFGESDGYYLLMGGLYLLLIGWLLYRLWQMKNRQKWWEAAAVSLTCFIQYALIVFNAWVIDFQPQGRYLLPVLFYIAYLISRVDQVREDKVFRTILCLTCLLSLFAFWHVGIPNLVPIHGIQS